jgi:hypothetical protein
MPAKGPVQEMREQRRKQRVRAKKKLENLVRDKINLKRPVFFVPGWTDEDNTCWKTAYRKGYVPIKDWISKIAKNSNLAEYITFTEKESEKCKSFFDFADVLKPKIWDKIGKNKKFDIVGHSMGGLDVVAAIIDDDKPLLNVYNLITVATPHQGSELGEIGSIFRKYKPHHALQCINLDPDQLPIKLINKLEARKTLLSRVDKLYCLMGTRDMAVMRSARYNKKSLNPELYKKKVKIVEFGGATHSQKYGITQDPRVILAIVNILLGIELEEPKYNYGYIYKRV